MGRGFEFAFAFRTELLRRGHRDTSDGRVGWRLALRWKAEASRGWHIFLLMYWELELMNLACIRRRFFQAYA